MEKYYPTAETKAEGWVPINHNQLKELPYQKLMGPKDIWESHSVLDRVVQQAILQVIEPIIDPHFSDNSFGFRKGRNAHQAIKLADNTIKKDIEWQ